MPGIPTGGFTELIMLKKLLLINNKINQHNCAIYYALNSNHCNIAIWIECKITCEKLVGQWDIYKISKKINISDNLQDKSIDMLKSNNTL